MLKFNSPCGSSSGASLNFFVKVAKSHRGSLPAPRTRAAGFLAVMPDQAAVDLTDWHGPSKDLNEHAHSAVAFIHYVNHANEVLELTVIDAHAFSLFETIWLRLIHARIFPRLGQHGQAILACGSIPNRFPRPGTDLLSTTSSDRKGVGTSLRNRFCLSYQKGFVDEEDLHIACALRPGRVHDRLRQEARHDWWWRHQHDHDPRCWRIEHDRD
jgi:hypothetical protein